MGEIFRGCSVKASITAYNSETKEWLVTFDWKIGERKQGLFSRFSDGFGELSKIQEHEALFIGMVIVIVDAVESVNDKDRLTILRFEPVRN